MTPTPPVSERAPHTARPTAVRPRAARPTAPRRALRAVAVASCLPYLALKVAWLAGSPVGVPEGSPLRSGTALFVVNALTAVLEAAVVLVAFALTSAWGRRLPAWLCTLPLWVATGLLAPVVVVAPATGVVGLFGWENAGSSDAGGFLDPWVFAVVYGGFTVQALALGGLFAGYLRDRWGWLLRGRIAALPPSATLAAQRACAVAATGLVGLVVAVELHWLGGGTAALSEHQAADRDAAFHLNAASRVLFGLAAAAGVWLLTFRPARWSGVRVGTATLLGWVGGAALACWGGWLLLAQTVFRLSTATDALTPLLALLYAGQMLAGTLILGVGARQFAERAAVGRPG